MEYSKLTDEVILAEQKFYAHSWEGRPKTEWQELSVHLKNVSKLAKEFAKIKTPTIGWRIIY